VTGSAAQASPHGERLVVRGTDTVLDSPACPGGVCELTLADGAFRGTTGKGAYAGAVKLKVAEAFPNGEGGVCAPIAGRITLGTGTPDRLVLKLDGISCQDGAGPPPASTFTGLAGVSVGHGTGRFAHARGYATAVFSEGADDREQMTLIGRLWN
jgi:hypothetical protein